MHRTKYRPTSGLVVSFHRFPCYMSKNFFHHEIMSWDCCTCMSHRQYEWYVLPISTKQNFHSHFWIFHHRPTVVSLQDTVFTIKEEFGFERQELKQILLEKPKVLMLSRWALQDRLQYLHNEMGLSHRLIADSANVLTYRSWRVRQRHLMLHMLSRDQYDRGRPGYVSLDRLVGTTDQEFCRDIAQMPVAAYNEFLKTLWYKRGSWYYGRCDRCRRAGSVVYMNAKYNLSEGAFQDDSTALGCKLIPDHFRFSSKLVHCIG